MELTPEQKKKRIETIAKVVIAGVVGLAVSPVIFLAIKGLVGLLIAGVIGFTAIQLAPYLAMKIANWKMKLIIAEASKNPIETMNNVYAENMRVIGEKDQKIAQFEGRLGDFRSQMKMFAQKFPQDVQQFASVEQKMQFVLDRQKTKQRQAKIEARKFHDEIVRAEAIYDMALAAHAVQQLSGDLEAQVYQDIKKRVSFDSVMHSFNTAVAELSVEADTDPDLILADTPVKGALPESVGTIPAPVIDAVPVEAVPVKVVRR